MARDEFSEIIKQTLGNRVAWCCSFPGCNAATIGPGDDKEQVIKLGEAAHIHAAAPGGPRYIASMTSEERKSIANGIWMCRMHARLIDQDHENYSADTLQLWKLNAEQHSRELLKNANGTVNDDPVTLIQIGQDLVFYARWVGAESDKWVVEVSNFIYGNKENLKRYCAAYNQQQESEKYIVIASEGDGRWLVNCPGWELKENKFFLTVYIKQKTKRTNPNSLGIDLDFSSGDLAIKNRDIATVRGIDSARQRVSTTLSVQPGEMLFHPGFGSYFSKYYLEHECNDILLSHLFKLEVARLASLSCDGSRSLDFINRVINVSFDHKVVNSRINVDVTMEWGEGSITTDKYWVYIHQKA